MLCAPPDSQSESRESKSGMAGMAVRRAMWMGRARTFAFFVLALVIVALSGVLAAKPAHAKTFIVNSIDDEADKTPGNGLCQITSADQCTLRAAIEEANASAGADTINFAIPGAGPHTISPGSELPTITQTVTIDGYTQSGASPNTLAQPDKTNAVLKIELSGPPSAPPPGQFVNGLELSGANASNSVIRGLVINHYDDGIFIGNGAGYKIEGNFIGTDPGGTVRTGNRSAGVDTLSTSNTTIGGTTPDKRNLISGNFYGLEVSGTGNKIGGNLIGTNKDGTDTPNHLGNTYGVLVGSQANNNTIGDSDPSDGPINAANVIAFNFGRGVTLGFGAGNGNRILSNSIYDNGLLGIDLLRQFDPASGVTPNDPMDKDTGPNGLQNYPDITSAQTLGGSTLINGTLNSTPSTRKKKRVFIIQFFSSPEDPPDSGVNDPSGYGEGETFLGQIQVKTDRQGNVSPSPFAFGINGDFSNRVVTATATNKRTGDTSEFSEAEPVQGIVIGP